ncbi:MAG: lysophospholipid acyltransferase family protein [Paracoccaceae bacterium]
MAESYQDSQLTHQHTASEKFVPYDKRKLSYSMTFTDPRKVYVIRAMEWLTGKITLLRRIRALERAGTRHGVEFFAQALEFMGIDLQTPQNQVENIPATGPLVVVANHPSGMVDGMVMAALVGRRRDDFIILTRSLLSGVKEISQFMLPVPFPHEEDAINESLKMRKKAMAHLKDGGVIILFPAGVVASSDNWFGEAIEREWSPFTAKMILRSKAAVLPIYFPGQNSRMYQIADHISATLRQGLLLHEVVHAMHKPQAPVVGTPIGRGEIDKWTKDPRGFMAWLREVTLALKDKPKP